MSAPVNAEILRHHEHPDELQLELLIPRSLIYFDGHFPNFPLLPGLVQIRWAIEFAKHLSGTDSIRQIQRLKFTNIIPPDTRLTLSLQYSAEEHHVRFHYFGDVQGGRISYSQGLLLYRA